ncbi:uncharacterized protein BDZ99DRAFT_397927, partial [Mytilinidion resinicola]
IRLLELLPAHDLNAPIRVRLKSVSLLDPSRPTYEALSYCWGDPADPGMMWCQRKGWPNLDQNLWAALFRLRLEDRKRLIWADSVCINQADDEEKSWQVSAYMVPVSGR